MSFFLNIFCPCQTWALYLQRALDNTLKNGNDSQPIKLAGFLIISNNKTDVMMTSFIIKEGTGIFCHFESIKYIPFDLNSV